MLVDQTKQIENNTSVKEKELPKTNSTGKKKAAGVIFDNGKMYTTYRTNGKERRFTPNAIYQKPWAKEEETVTDQLEDQLNMSVENRKNQMIVLSNTVSSEDLQKMGEEGFSSLDMDSHTIITVTDKIKATLAKAGVDISGYGGSLSKEELEAVIGNTAVANQIANELKKADLPVTKANMEECMKAYAVAEQLQPLNDASKEYLLKNGYEPTINNLYKASYCGVLTPPQKLDLSGLEGQMAEIIKSSGLEVTGDTMNSCKWLIERNIELTTSNLKYLEKLNQFSGQLATNEQMVGNLIEAVRDGKQPMDALVIGGFSYADRAQAAMDTIMAAGDGDIAYCIDQNIPVSVDNLEKSINYRGETSGTPVSEEMFTSISFIKAKRQLEETRLIMTTKANYALLKRGFAIDTKPLEQVVERLKDLEKRYTRDLMTHSGVEATEKNISLFETTTKYVEELKYHPAYALQLTSANDSLRKVHHAGSNMKATMEAALKSYETMWTSPNSDLGDSIQKAFENIDERLKDLGLEINEMNRRAVRILAHNQTDLTVENVMQMKVVDMEMQKLFHNLTPATTLELIRRGENPLDMEIKQLNEIVESIHTEDSGNEQERFNKFLWKLEQKNDITAEERESYIGIYRLIAQVEKEDGAALGALVNQGADITMRNLLMATRSARAEIDYAVDDEFKPKRTAQEPRIDTQIMASFQNSCLKQSANILSPEKLANVDQWENMTPEQLLEALQEQVDNTESIELEQQYHAQLAQEYGNVLEASDDVYAFLEKYDIKNSANNVLAASRLLENPSNVFDTLFGTEGKSLNYQKMIADMKEKVLKNFGEAVKTPKEMAEAQATLAEVAEKVMQTMIIENEPVSVKDLKDLRLMNQQIFLGKERAKEESFLVPVETSDGGVTGINLKIVRGKADKGLIDIFFRGALMQKVAASFEAKENGISGIIATTDIETKKLFEENIKEFTDRVNADGREVMDIHVTYVKDLSAWQFEKKTLSETGEATPVQTKRLYHIAESFIQTVSDLM